jgi:protein TonB
MNGTWNFKFFLSISLGLHLFVLSLLSILLPDFKIDPLPSLNIEVSLLPMVREEGELLRKVEYKYKVRSSPARRTSSLAGGEFGVRSKEEEPFKIVERREESPKPESTVKTQEEKRVSQIEKVEVTLPQKEQDPVSVPTVQKEVRVAAVSEPQPFLTVNDKKEPENKKEERIVIASLGNPIPPQSSPETSQVVMKSPSLSESEIAIPQPKSSENQKPLYPREAKEKGFEGEVLLKVMVLSNGRVGGIELKRSSGHEVLDHSAMSAVKKWKFIPAKKGEVPVPLWVNIPVIFQLQ